MKQSTSALAAILLLGALTSARGQYVEDSIDVGGRFATSMTYSNNWGTVYGTCASGAYYVIFRGGYAMTWALRTPRDVAYDSIDDQCYIIYSTGGDDSIRVARGSNGGRIRSFALPWADKCLWDAHVNRLYVTRGWLNSVAVIDCATDSVIADIAVGSSPFHMAMNPTRRKLYVGNWDGESVSVIDLNALRVVRTVPLGLTPRAVAYGAVGDKCYFGGEGGFRVIDCETDTMAASVSLPGGASVTSFEPVPAHARMLAASYTGGADFVYAIDAYGDTVVAAARTGRVPRALSYSSVTDQVYCACATSGSVSVLSGDGSRVVANLEVGDYPSVILAVPDHHAVYVGHTNTNYVYVIRDTTSGVSERPEAMQRKYPLLTAQPNPFAEYVRIKAARRSAVSAQVFSADGRLIRSIEAARTQRGSEFTWDGQDDTGREVRPGVYAIVVGAQRLKVLKVR